MAATAVVLESSQGPMFLQAARNFCLAFCKKKGMDMRNAVRRFDRTYDETDHVCVSAVLFWEAQANSSIDLLVVFDAFKIEVLDKEEEVEDEVRLIYQAKETLLPLT